MSIFDKVQNFTVNYSADILIGMGLAGMLASTVSAVMATPKALDLIAEEEDILNDELTFKETVKVAYKPYIPAAIGFVGSAACILGANYIHHDKHSTVIAACTLTEKAYNEYKTKVIEKYGEDEDRRIREHIAVDKMHRDTIGANGNSVIITGKGDYLCYDAFSGRYFKGDTSKINNAINDINYTILHDMHASINEYYDLIGLDSIKAGDSVGWNTNMPLVEVIFSSQLADDGQPCMVIDFSVEPVTNFNIFG